MLLERLAEYAGDCGPAKKLVQIEECLAPCDEGLTSDGFISRFRDFASLRRRRFCSWLRQAYNMMGLWREVTPL